LSGDDNECPQYEVLGYRNHPGGYAELTKVPIQNLVPLPETIPFVDAAAFPLTFVTAWHMLITRARLQRGEDVLVLAAGSGVGQAAV
jgi:NADPH:quinone reductase-like Zn-dependent oxidoreductase